MSARQLLGHFEAKRNIVGTCMKGTHTQKKKHPSVFLTTHSSSHPHGRKRTGSPPNMFRFHDCGKKVNLLLMEGILNQLGCIQAYNYGPLRVYLLHQLVGSTPEVCVSNCRRVIASPRWKNRRGAMLGHFLFGIMDILQMICFEITDLLSYTKHVDKINVWRGGESEWFWLGMSLMSLICSQNWKLIRHKFFCVKNMEILLKPPI